VHSLREIDGKRCNDFPTNAKAFARCVPIYQTVPGWNTSTETVRALTDLPKQALDYLKFLAERMKAGSDHQSCPSGPVATRQSS
jgi:adenylosuccinate synthase